MAPQFAASAARASLYGSITSRHCLSQILQLCFFEDASALAMIRLGLPSANHMRIGQLSLCTCRRVV